MGGKPLSRRGTSSPSARPFLPTPWAQLSFRGVRGGDGLQAELYQRCFVAKLNTRKEAQPKAAPSASRLGMRSAPSGVFAPTSWCHLRLLLRSRPLWKPSGMGWEGWRRRRTPSRGHGAATCSEALQLWMHPRASPLRSANGAHSITRH